MKWIWMIALSLCSASAFAACSAGRYTVNGNFVLDRQTHKIWVRCAAGLSGAACTGEVALMNYEEAQATASALPGWRIPTHDELMTLIHPKCQRPSANSRAFPRLPAQGLWTATPAADRGSAGQWVVNLYTGFDEIVNNGSQQALLLIRESRE